MYSSKNGAVDAHRSVLVDKFRHRFQQHGHAAAVVGTPLLEFLIYRTIVGAKVMQDDERLIGSVARNVQVLVDGPA